GSCINETWFCAVAGEGPTTFRVKPYFFAASSAPLRSGSSTGFVRSSSTSAIVGLAALPDAPAGERTPDCAAAASRSPTAASRPSSAPRRLRDRDENKLCISSPSESGTGFRQLGERLVPLP